MKTQDTDSSKSAVGNPGVRQAKLPDEEEKPEPSSSPEPDNNGPPTDREDGDAIPPTRTKDANSPESGEEDENDLEKLERWERQLRSKYVTTTVDTLLPPNEAQTRPLQSNSGDVDFLWSAWRTAVEEFGLSPRRKDVKSIVDELTTEDSGTKASGKEKNEGGKSEVESEPSDLSEDLAGEFNSKGNSGSRGSESVLERSKELNEVKSDPEPRNGFSIGLEETSDAPHTAGSSSNEFSSLAKTDLENSAEEFDQKEPELPKSSGDHMVASKVWKVVVSSSGYAETGLPEKVPAEVVLKIDRLGQITGLPPGLDGERVLVCPGVDLFREIVPDGPIEAILERCRKTDHKPVVFTRRLERASEFDLSGMWVGTQTGRSSLKTTEQRLRNAAPDAAVQWLLYDVTQADRKDPPSFSDEVDWVVYDPGVRHSGIALELSEAEALIGAAVEADAEWAFRNSFTTCGTSLATPCSSS